MIPTAVAALSIELMEICPAARAASGDAWVTIPGSTCWMASTRLSWACGKIRAR